MIERKQFSGGMDAETVVDFVDPNDYLVANNCRVLRDESGNAQAVKPVNGTTLRVNHEDALPKRTIGSITDEEKGRVYWFMKQEGGSQDDTIWMWDRKSNTGYRVLRSGNVTDGLNLLNTFPVNGLALIGDFLYWTDNNNEPRRINVERALRTNNPSYVSQDGTTPEAYTLPIKQTDITVFRRMPKFSPTVEKILSIEDSNVDNRSANLIKGNSFQFAYRYINKDGQSSVFSPYSLLVEHPGDNDNYDTIRVEISTDEVIDEETQVVEILMRKGNLGSWSIVKTFDRREDDALMTAHNSGTALGFYFYNDDVGIAVSDGEADVLFHDVPHKSKGLEIANNRLFLANNEKGYDYVTDINLQVSLAPQEEIDIVGSWVLMTIDCPAGTSEFVLINVTGVNVPGYSFVNQYYYDPSYTPAAFNAGTLPATVPLNFGLGVGDAPFQALTPCPGVAYTVSWTSYTGDPNVIVTGLVPVTVYESNNVLKQNSSYEVGIVFFDDAGRNSGVAHSTVSIENPFDFFASGRSVGIDWVLPSGPNLNIPEWAKSYSIVRSKNLTYDSFVQTIVTEARYGNKDASGAYVFSDTTYANQEAIGINLLPLISDGIGYTYQDGDFIRVLQVGVNYTLRVIGAQGNYIVASAKDVGDLSGTWIIEIYRNAIRDNLFYEVGHEYLINNPGTANREFSTISGRIRGDVYVEQVGFGATNINLEKMNKDNDYWQIWDTDIGRSNLVFFSKKRRYETEVAWSGVYFPGTNSNDLNAFLSNDIRTLDSLIGSIQKLVFTSRTQEYGNVMLALGTADVASLYIGRVELYNAEEGANVVSSGDVIGSVNVLRGGFGTINPESVVENDGNVYYFSAIKGAFARYNRDGVNNISYRFMPVSKWLGNKILNNDTNYLVPGGYDEYNDEAVWSLPVEPRSAFPIEYDVLDELDEEVEVTVLGGVIYQATLEAGDVYKFVITVPSIGNFVIVQLTDYLFGFPATFSGTGALEYDFQFVANTTGTNNFAIAVPASGVTIKLYKQKLNPYVVNDNMPKTVCFNEQLNRWSLVQRAVPEWFGRIGDVLLSYKNAVLYSHDDTTNKSRFYGVDYVSFISFVANGEVTQKKRFQGVSLETDRTPDYVHIRTEIPNIQSSDLVSSDFDVREGIPYGAFLKDGLSPNVSGTRFEKQRKGDDIVGRYAKVLIEYAKNSTFVTRIINIISRMSAGHKT